MRHVVQHNPESKSYNVQDLDRMHADSLREQMLRSAPDVYEQHVELCMRLQDAKEAHLKIEAYWSTMVGDIRKTEARTHLDNIAQQRRNQRDHEARIKALTPKKS